MKDTDNKTDWDKEVSNNMSSKWYDIIRECLQHGNLFFKQSTRPPNAIGKPKIVTFWDGSFAATCAVVYVIWQVSTDAEKPAYVSTIAAAKGKVSPMRGLTVPRSECNSLTLATRITIKVVTSLPTTPAQVTLIGDSQCTISAVDNTTSLFTPFMHTRLSEVIENIEILNNICPVEKLMYIKTELNIADLGTRCDGKLKDIGINSTWQTGPAFLQEERKHWPITRDFIPQPPPKDEIKMSPRLISCTTSISTRNTLIDFFKNYSNTLKDVEFIIGQSIYKLKKAVPNTTMKFSRKDAMEAAQLKILLSDMPSTKEALDAGKLENLMINTREDG